MFSIKDFFSECEQIHSFLLIWSHLLEISLMENFIFYAVNNVRKWITIKLAVLNYLEAAILACSVD